jgi:hypothetical protein
MPGPTESSTPLSVSIAVLVTLRVAFSVKPFLTVQMRQVHLLNINVQVTEQGLKTSHSSPEASNADHDHQGHFKTEVCFQRQRVWHIHSFAQGPVGCFRFRGGYGNGQLAFPTRVSATILSPV